MKILGIILIIIAVALLLAAIWAPEYRWQLFATAILASIVGAAIGADADKKMRG